MCAVVTDVMGMLHVGSEAPEQLRGNYAVT